MKEKILNFIIFFSVVGIVALTAKEYFYPDKSQEIIKQVKQKAQEIAPTLQPKPVDKEIPCDNKYFTFKKGTKWVHSVDVAYSYDKVSQKYNDTVTTEVIATSESTITLENSYKNSTDKITNKIVCKESGIYGLPFSFPNADKVEKLGIKFFPKDVDVKLGVWKNEVGFDIPLELPIPLPKIGVTLNNTASTSSAKILTIKSKVDLGALLSTDTMKNIDFMEYTLKEKAGLNSLVINFDYKNVGSIKVNIRLLSFK
jgi:hypothetical protein